MDIGLPAASVRMQWCQHVLARRPALPGTLPFPLSPSAYSRHGGCHAHPFDRAPTPSRPCSSSPLLILPGYSFGACLQVEYAIEAIKLGSTAIGIQTSEGARHPSPRPPNSPSPRPSRPSSVRSTEHTSTMPLKQQRYRRTGTSEPQAVCDLRPPPPPPPQPLDPYYLPAPRPPPGVKQHQLQPLLPPDSTAFLPPSMPSARYLCDGCACSVALSVNLKQSVKVRRARASAAWRYTRARNLARGGRDNGAHDPGAVLLALFSDQPGNNDRSPHTAHRPHKTKQPCSPCTSSLRALPLFHTLIFSLSVTRSLSLLSLTLLPPGPARGVPVARVWTYPRPQGLFSRWRSGSRRR